MELTVQNKLPCINCEQEYRSINDFCQKCYIIVTNEINILEEPFYITYYDSLQSQYVKKQYFEKYYYNFIKLFSNNTNFKLMHINSQHKRVFILNSLLSNSNLNLSHIFLTLNLYDSNHVSYMITHSDIKYLNKEKFDKNKFNHLLGGIVMDPWNCCNSDIKELYGYHGKIPNTIIDICQLWFNNKLTAQKMLDNIHIKYCSACNYSICLQDLNIQQTPYIPDNHSKCLNQDEIKDLCDLMNNKIEL
jgi:hypothetical protein